VVIFIHGDDQHADVRGTVVATAQTAVPGRPSPAELVVHRIDLHLAHLREGVGALLEEERRPALYGELVEGVAVA